MSMLKSVSLSSCQVVKLSRCQVVKFDPWDMLNNFCFHVYAQKSLFVGENVFFCDVLIHRGVIRSNRHYFGIQLRLPFSSHFE